MHESWEAKHENIWAAIINAILEKPALQIRCRILTDEQQNIYFFNYLFIRKLYLLEVILLDWIIKLKRSIIYVLLQIVYFQKVLNVSDMEYFMYPSMFRQFNVYNIVEEPGRMYPSGTLELSTFISKPQLNYPGNQMQLQMSCSFYIVATQKRLYQKCYFKNGGSSKRCLLNGVHTAVSKLCKTFCVFIFIMLFLFCYKNQKNVLQKKIKD